MKAFESDLTLHATVLFHEPEKAQHFFIDDESNDAWSKYFFSFTDLAALSLDIAKGLYHNRGMGRAFVEGYGEFDKDYSTGMWVLKSGEFGDITVDMGELDNEFNPVDVTKEINKRFAHLTK